MSAGKVRLEWEVPRLALSVEEACNALGVSHDFWQEHVADEVRIVRRGRRKLVAVDELRRWLEKSAAVTLEGGVRR
jgi:excisionase family DNA binding protein